MDAFEKLASKYYCQVADFEAGIDLMYPKILRSMGFPEPLIEILISSLKKEHDLALATTLDGLRDTFNEEEAQTLLDFYEKNPSFKKKMNDFFQQHFERLGNSLRPMQEKVIKDYIDAMEVKYNNESKQ